MKRRFIKILHCRCREEVIGNAIIQAVQDNLDAKSAKQLNKSTINGGRSAFFAGAGISVDSGLPDFHEFSKHILQNTLPSHASITEEDIAMFASEMRPEILLQTMHEIYGDNIFDFYRWFEGAKPSTCHYVLAKALRRGGLVLTTNVDTLIEDAYEELYDELDYKILLTDKDFDIPRETLRDSREGTLVKLHGSLELLKDGHSRYDTVRSLLDNVGEGCLPSMRSLLTHICREYDMIYLGYSGCDNFSVHHVLRDVQTNRTTLWLWNEWPRTKMILESSKSIYENEQKHIAKLVTEGKSFAQIPRGMETLSTCEILSNRQSAFRFRGDIRSIVTEAAPDESRKPENMRIGPVPPWVRNIPVGDAMRCAARLYSISGRLDMAISLLEDAKSHPDVTDIQKALILKDLGNQYANVVQSPSYEKALQCLEDSKVISNSLDDYETLLDTQLDIADILRRMQHLDEAEEIIHIVQGFFAGCQPKTYVEKGLIRLALIKGLIAGVGRTDAAAKISSILILEKAAQDAVKNGFVSLQAAVLNASSLIKYQNAGDNATSLELIAKDIDKAYRLNIIIGDSRSCFRLARILGLIWLELSHLKKMAELTDPAIQYFRRAEKFLLRLSGSQFIRELLEIRLLLGKALVAGQYFKEAEEILLDVQKHHARLGDWYSEVQTLELLVKAASNSDNLIKRCEQIRDIYEDVKNNETKKELFEMDPNSVKKGRYILREAANYVRKNDDDLAMVLQKLMVEAFKD